MRLPLYAVMPGGSGANVATWLARLGSHVTLAGRVGDDYFGQWLAGDLAAQGVDLALVTDSAHGTAVIQVLVEPDGERTMVPDRGANAHWAAGDVSEELISRADWLHVVGYVLYDAESRYGALQAMHYARRHGVPVSLDPSSHAPLRALGSAGFWSLIGDVSILFPNRIEAQRLSGKADPDAALDVLLAHVGLVAIKLDRDGCLAGVGAERCREPVPTTTVVNATGAGDAFNAAFLHSWLAQHDLRAACQAGVVLGSRVAGLWSTR